MDRRHGSKRPHPTAEKEETKKEQLDQDDDVVVDEDGRDYFNISQSSSSSYSTGWSESDMSAMVSSLSQVMQTPQDQPPLKPTQSTSSQDQGTFVFPLSFLFFFFLFPIFYAHTMFKCFRYYVKNFRSKYITSDQTISFSIFIFFFLKKKMKNEK